MKRIIYIVAIIAATISTAMAQSIKTAYFMPNATLRGEMNPALRPTSGYVNIPLLGGINANFSSNALSLDNLLYPIGGELVWFLDSKVPAASIMGSLKSNNKIEASASINLFGFGFQSGKAFWSAGINLRVNSATNLPKSLFEFVKVGSQNNGVYNFKNINADVNTYGELYVGYSRPIGDKLTIGARVKYLAGIANTRVFYDNLTLAVSDTEWKADVTGRFELSANGAIVSPTEDERYIDLSNIDLSINGLGGHGLGVDLGVNYKLLDNLNLSAALTDIGFIAWNKKHTISGRYNMKYVFNGIDITGEDTNYGNLDDLLNFELKDATRRTTSLATTLNIAGEYSILNNKIGFGLLSSTRFGAVTTTELTASANFRPLRWFSGSLSYSFIHSRFRTFGLALNFNPSWINFFIGTDYMITKVTPQMIPVKARAVNLYVGLAVPIGYRKTR